MELGTNLSWLENSETLALGGRLRIGLLEGYQGYAPDVSVYAAVNRMLGLSELDLTTLAAGATLSYRQSISGVMSVSPFFGFDFICSGWQQLARRPQIRRGASGCPRRPGDTCPAGDLQLDTRRRRLRKPLQGSSIARSDDADTAELIRYA